MRGHSFSKGVINVQLEWNESVAERYNNITTSSVNRRKSALLFHSMIVINYHDL